MVKTCSIEYHDGWFHLSNEKVSYIMELKGGRWLLHRYWGSRIEGYDGSNQPELMKRAFASTPDPDDEMFSLEMAPLEFSTAGRGDFRTPSISVRRTDGCPAVRFCFESWNVEDGLHIPEGLPHVRPSEEYEAKTLTIRFRDESTDTVLELLYSILEERSCIVRSARIVNEGTEPVFVERALSVLLDTHWNGEELVTLHGSHLAEFQVDRRAILHGKTALGSTRGASSPQYPAFAVLCSPDAGEHAGNVRAFSLIYSDNHLVEAELDQYDSLRVVLGINPQDFSYMLGPEESFETPQAVLVSSEGGFNGMSREFHQLWTDRLFPPQWAKKIRPLLLNSWEMCYFDVSEEKMLKVIREAASLGFELVVLDDGWFGCRNDSKSSLGDWSVNPKKFPNGLDPLIACAKENGIQFGIWFEPEMISPNSELMRAHPDWAVRFPNVEPLLSRNQLVLDLARPEIQDYVIKTLTSFLKQYPVSYVKWDMNRHITDAGSMLLPDERMREFPHRYMRGLYRILRTLTEEFPDVLFENCSSGGGRFDPGMSFYMPQTWCSDNTDALDRQSIQYGASYLFPPSAIAAHVSEIPNHQTGRRIPFVTRTDTASMVNMGYELNILELSEEERARVQAHLAEYKAERRLVFQGAFYRLRSPFHGKICAVMLTDAERTEAIIYAFTPAYSVTALCEMIRIPYLASGTVYEDILSGKRFSGSELQKAGLAFRFDKGDYPAKKFHLRALQETEDD